MDIRYLLLGKFEEDDTVNNNDHNVEYLEASSYFDWIKLVQADCTNICTINNAFNHRAISEIRKQFLQNSKNMHLQEMMILASDEDGGNFLSESISSIYISMINIPIVNEDCFNNVSKYHYAVYHKIIMRRISRLCKNYPCRVYHTFDHCDFVLVADGSKIYFKDYIKLLKSIRSIARIISGQKVPMVHDVNTIFGYLPFSQIEEQKLNNSSLFDRDSFDFGVKLSLRLLENKEYFFSKLKEILGSQANITYLDTIGRYDCTFMCHKISLEEFYKIAKMLRDNSDKLFAHCLKIGLEGDFFSDNVAPLNCYCQYNTSKLLKNYCAFFEEKYKSLQNSERLFSVQLRSAILEVHNSIRSMLKKGFAQYYILSFYESFYSFVEFLYKLNSSYYEDNLDRSDLSLVMKNERNRLSEKINDMYRIYFGVLNALNTSTMHNDRQFLQIDSYQMLYFDAPPKLIAFYTAIANKIVNLVENENENRYTFLITPDFKKDIFVESLTEDRNMGHEHNILIIHMNEESMYDVVSTIKKIIHEIFHHIGQTKEMRKKRAVLILKSCIAYFLSQTLNADYIFQQVKNENPNDNECDEIFYHYFVSLVNIFYNAMFPIGDCFKVIEKYHCDNCFHKPPCQKCTENIQQEDFTDKKSSLDSDFSCTQCNSCYYMQHCLKCKDEEKEKTWYYSQLLIKFFGDYLSEFFKDYYKNDVVYNFVRESCKTPFSEYSSIFFNDRKENKETQSILTRFSVNEVSNSVQYHMYHWLINHNETGAYSMIQYTFRESFADFYMLRVTTEETQQRSQLYMEMIEANQGSDVEEEKPRIVAVLKSLIGDKSEGIDEFEYIKEFDSSNYAIFNKNTNDEEKSLYDLFFIYLKDNVAEYLSDAFNEIKSIPNDIIEIIKQLEQPDVTVDSIVELMDKEIFDYRKRLLRKHNDNADDISYANN